MIKLVALFCLLACSSSKDKLLSGRDLERSLTIIDQVDTVYEFGPTSKQETVFVDKTEEYGLAGYKGYNFFVVDLDGDGHSDLVILESFYDTPVFLRFDPEIKKFKPFKHDFFDRVVKASYLLFYDFNNDGILDVVVGVLNQKTEIEKSPLELYLGQIKEGNLIFKKDPKAVQLAAGAHSTVVPLDYNLDGKLDLFVGNWLEIVKGNPISTPDILLENKNGKFSLKKTALTDEWERNSEDSHYVNATPTYGASICDIDQNGFPDILTTSTNGADNKLWMNQYRLRVGERYFQNYGKESRFSSDTEGNLNPFGGGRTFSGVCADYNDDGIMDIFLGELSHSYDSISHDKSSVLTGSRLKFPPLFIRTEYFKESESSLWHQSDKRALWQDFSNNGQLDILVDNSGYPPYTRMMLFQQEPDHAFDEKSKEVGIDIINPTSSVVLDVNRDGNLDIITGQMNIRNAKIKERIYFFENQTKHEAKVFRFFPHGQKSHRWAIGGMLIFKIIKNGKVKYKRRNIEYSYGGLPPQNELGIHFALQKDEKLEWVKVRWPYATNLAQDVASLEKTYQLNIPLQDYNEVTLCENGKVLQGKMRACQ